MVSKESQPHIAIAIELDYALPWHQHTFEGVMQYGREQGWFCHIDPLLTGYAGQDDLSSYDGVVGRLTAELSGLAVQSNLPAVSLMTSFSPSEPHSVSIDSMAGGRMIAEHLLTSGYRVFGQVLTGAAQPRGQIAKGFEDELAAHGFAKPSGCLLPLAYESDRQSNKANRQAITQWIQSTSKPIGVVLQAITPARYLAQTCLELGLRIPEDVGIVVHDGDEVMVNHVTPTLSSVEYDFFKQGYEAAALLDRLMQGKPCDPRHHLIKPKRVVVRESTDVFLNNNPVVSKAMRFIAKHVRQHLTIEDVASHLNIGDRTLCRHFEQALGRTVFSEIKRLRIDHIKRLLLETDRSLEAIAGDCGFSSPSHFSRYFKADTAVSPSQFRKTSKA